MSAGEESNSSSDMMDVGEADAWSQTRDINVLPMHFNQGAQPCVTIVEQPQERGHRFRYACEGKSHGVVKGARSVGRNRSFPSIQVHNYSGKALIRISLVTRSGGLHDHELTGEKCNDGIYEISRNISAAPLQFQDLCILHVTKKRAQEKRKRLGIQVPKGKGKGNKSDIEDKIVHLKFDVGLEMQAGILRWLDPVISGPIYDGKGTTTSALTIYRLSKHSSSSLGNEEVFLLCDKVNKDDIEVHFYEIDSKGNRVWESVGQFGPTDVHHQVAIVFKTPRYLDSHIKGERNVKIQLYRPSDEEKSDGIDFKYLPPVNTDLESVKSKRKKPIPQITDTNEVVSQKPVRRRTTKPKSAPQPPAYNSPQMSPQNQIVHTPSPPMATNIENNMYTGNQNGFQQDQDLAFLLQNEPTVTQTNRVVQVENNMYTSLPSQMTPSPASTVSLDHMVDLKPVQIGSPQSYNPDSPHQVANVDGVTRIVDENGQVVDLDQLTDAILDDKGNQISVNDLLTGGTHYEIVAIQDDFRNTDILMNSATNYMPVSSAESYPPMVYSTAETIAAAQNIPVMIRNDIETDEAPDSLAPGIETDDIVLPPHMNNKLPQMPHGPLKSLQQQEGLRSIYDSGLGSLRSGLQSMEASLRDEEKTDAMKVEVTEKETVEEARSKSDDTVLAEQTKKKLVLSRPSKETSSEAGDIKPTIDVTPPISPPEDVENRPAKSAISNRAVANPKRVIIVKRKTLSKCTERGSESARLAVSGEVKDTDMRMAAKMSEGLQCFAQTGDIKYLLALQRHLIDVPDGAGDNAIHLAIVHKKLEPLRHLLMINQRIANSNAINAYNEDKQTPLHLAVISEEDYMIELLMEYGAKLDVVNGTGNNPLQLAASMGSYRCVQSMLTKGEGVRVTQEFLSKLNYDGLSAMHLAVISGNLRCVEHLVHSHADVNQRDGKSGYTPLHHAVENERSNIVGYLQMQEAIEPNMPGYNGATALHCAVSRGNLGLAAALVGAGADPEAESAEPLEDESEDEDKDKDTTQAETEIQYLTPLDMAQGNPKMVRILKGESYSNVRTKSDSSITDLTSRLQSTVITSAESETVSVLDIVTRRNLSKLLDPPKQDEDWVALAKLFHLGELVEILSTLSSPTSSLIDNLEAMETTVFSLKQKLLALKRMDAVEVLHEALSISEKARRDHAQEKEAQVNSSRR